MLEHEVGERVSTGLLVEIQHALRDLEPLAVLLEIDDTDALLRVTCRVTSDEDLDLLAIGVAIVERNGQATAIDAFCTAVLPFDRAARIVVRRWLGFIGIVRGVLDTRVVDRLDDTSGTVSTARDGEQQKYDQSREATEHQVTLGQDDFRFHALPMRLTHTSCRHRK